MSSVGAAVANPDPITERLEDQIAWYDKKSASNQRIFKRIKVTEIIAAACIPFVGTFPLTHPAWITGALGVLVTILEGLLQLSQYQQNWINYRAICESLRHEKYLYLAKAGPYAHAESPYSLLAETIESLISQEQAKWASALQQQTKTKGS